MNFEAIEVVSQAFGDFLEAAFDANQIDGGVYVGPLDDPDAAEAAAVLFLYRIAVNADLRNTPHRSPPADPGGRPVVFDGALPLDLYYLLTAGTAQTRGELSALRTLGCALQALNQDPNLVGLPVRGEVVRLTLETVTSEEMGRVWTLFPTANFRTSVVYLASPVWIDPPVVRAEGPPVIREPHRVGHGTLQDA